ncbi:MAG: peptidoglycan DD-metalloendopeptidase family protein [Candidatus Brocadiaceae bacterium]|nr:peptidoglycan DD-metalloendopeptidase family protein [Candidatus Brocadiaceae bacterium]
MKISVLKCFVSIVHLIFIMHVVTGCATDYRSNMSPPPRLKKDLDSLIPNTSSKKTTRYTIKKGDTIWKISKNHGVTTDGIIKTNNIKDVSNLKPGQQLIIPRGISSKGTTTTRKTPTFNKQSNESFKWPLRGKILYGFDKWIDGYKNKGIDIQAFRGQAVMASKSGVVALVSKTPDGWGKVIVLQHYDGSYTWYAYNSRILVKKGDRVNQGRTIAEAGSTGKAKQDKLHFKIFLNGVPVNPTSHLR